GIAEISPSLQTDCTRIPHGAIAAVLLNRPPRVAEEMPVTRIASVAASATPPLSAAPTASATSAVSAAALASLASGAPPTLADVARLAGVSAATASRVLTGSAHVQPETRVRVEQAIAQLRYVRNRASRAARLQQAGSI